MADEEFQAELDNLRGEISNLRANFRGLEDALKETGYAGAASLKGSASEFAEYAEEEAKRLLTILRAQSKKSIKTAEQGVSNHPYISLLAAFGVGFLIAKLTGRKKQRSRQWMQPAQAEAIRSYLPSHQTLLELPLLIFPKRKVFLQGTIVQ